eukprot:TRINITY_DN3928_c0_g2_i1.p1 TRINITY_DN3928_c0_g2~~TRINITY_DN3928_c0_g2_i1.p1  ORF type:complete len:242 (+),score=56.36 TRINITY_DN3928_c0_g2_i1:46-771(+)
MWRVLPWCAAAAAAAANHPAVRQAGPAAAVDRCSAASARVWEQVDAVVAAIQGGGSASAGVVDAVGAVHEQAGAAVQACLGVDAACATDFQTLRATLQEVQQAMGVCTRQFREQQPMRGKKKVPKANEQDPCGDAILYSGTLLVKAAVGFNTGSVCTRPRVAGGCLSDVAALFSSVHNATGDAAVAAASCLTAQWDCPRAASAAASSLAATMMRGFGAWDKCRAALPFGGWGRGWTIMPGR